jgi:acyl-CoA thioesterase I
MRRWSSVLWLALILGACDRPGNGEVVRSAPSEVSSRAPTLPPVEAAASPAIASSDRGSDDAVILFLGTSLTEGYGLPDPAEAYPGLIQEQIERTNLPFRVVNAGVAGETSAGGLARLAWVLRQKPRILVVELGANDGLRGLPVEAMEENLRAVVRESRERVPGIEVVLLEMEAPPNLGPAYTRAFREVYRSVSRAEGTALVPFFLDGIAGVRHMNQADGIHPTSEGHARMADRVWDTLEPLLTRLAGGDA